MAAATFLGQQPNRIRIDLPEGQMIDLRGDFHFTMASHRFDGHPFGMIRRELRIEVGQSSFEVVPSDWPQGRLKLPTIPENVPDPMIERRRRASIRRWVRLRRALMIRVDRLLDAIIDII